MSIAEALDMITNKSESGIRTQIIIKGNDDSVIYKGSIGNISDTVKNRSDSVFMVSKGSRTSYYDWTYEIMLK